MSDYIHGYDLEEQARLVAQANYWRERLILREVDFAEGDAVLELGCGVGAVLGILGQAYPSLRLAGIDLQSTQIDYARKHLETLELTADLRVGDASQLPWAESQFDQVCTTWFLEHLPQPELALKEAYRVLQPGGRLSLTEPDYMKIRPWPVNSDYDYLISSLCDLLIQSGGSPAMGPRLGPLLESAGFSEVRNQAWGYHYFQTTANQELKKFVEYVDGWLAPTVPQIAQKLGRDPQQLAAGLDFLRQLPHQPDGAITATIFRATGQKPL
ncbi:Demethylmenaquinone methyltransferase [Acaryochloris thomasi RCC1774]|uniref:Demethylmenaquinone methyltransferase n=1 Tax=Acaryochloris thomasi RCC1774 TaxID=1764569 RepID=A0A2W1JX37_9CYAN|nr:class I SAM-dependent methyltransferase [Acaryochloris thomasi]PZD74702.1 Demethylmenaquinone methyltransferase [Acaryochloris thomasi RCC1774]